MIIWPITKIQHNGCVKLQAQVEYENKNNLLWYTFDDSVAEYLTDEVHDGFLVGLLPLAMKTGEDIIVKGAISERLFYNLSNYYVEILTRIIPSFKKVKIIPESLSDGSRIPSQGGVITGFSAGIDSFCTIYDHFLESTPSNYKITHLLFNNVGSHGEFDAIKAESVFLSRYELIKGFAKESKLPFIRVNSNLSDLLKMNFQQTHVPRNVSSVLMLQKLIGKYYYASTYRYEDSFVGKTYDMAYSDPFAVHLLSTEKLECISSGCQHSRVVKTERVSNVPSSRDWLNVCVSPKEDGSNCSTCWKCNRTLITFEILGVIDSYKNVFDLGKWKWSKKWYIPEVILNSKNKDPLVAEIRLLARNKNYTFTWKQKVFGAFVTITHGFIYKALKSIYHRI
jgi:hypothetical protein